MPDKYSYNSRTKRDDLIKIIEAMKADMNAATEGIYDPIAEKKTEEKKQTLSKAKESIDMGIFNTSVTDRYNAIQEAITIKQKELEELIGVEKEYLDLTAMMNTKEKVISDLEEEKEAKIEDYSQKIADLREQLFSLEAERKEEEKIYKANLDKTREEENKQYEFDLNIKRSQEERIWQKEKAIREEALAVKETEIKDRENHLVEMQDQIDELTAKVEEIPDLIEKAKEDAIKATEAEYERKKAIKESYSKKAKEAEEKLTTETIARKDQEIAELKAKLATAEERLNNAYDKINEVAIQSAKASQIQTIEK